MRVNDVQRVTVLIALVWAGLLGVGLVGCTKGSAPSAEPAEVAPTAVDGDSKKDEGKGRSAEAVAAPPPQAVAAPADGLRGGGTELGNHPGQG